MALRLAAATQRKLACHDVRSEHEHRIRLSVRPLFEVDASSPPFLVLDAARPGWWHLDPVTQHASWDAGYARIFGVEGLA